MPHLPDERQIREALDAEGLIYLLDLNPELPAQLSIWLNRLLTSPRNLSAVREPQAAILKHVIEPLLGRHRLLSADLPLPHGPMIDIGSGNGAPGLPIALCEPERGATLLDARLGAAEFLIGVLSEIDAPRIGVLRERAERAARSERRARFTLVVSRAAAPPAAALELMIPFLQIGGVAALWSGELSAPDIDVVAGVVAELGATLTPVDPPGDLLVATKVRATDSRYPRPWNQIRRAPAGGPVAGG